MGWHTFNFSSASQQDYLYRYLYHVLLTKATNCPFCKLDEIKDSCIKTEIINISVAVTANGPYSLFLIFTELLRAERLETDVG